MHNEYPTDLDKSTYLLLGETKRQKSNKFGCMKTGRTTDDIAGRLKLLMRAHGMKTQAELARVVGATPTAVNNYLLGKSRPELAAGIAIADHFRITLDWLYLGKDDHLSANVWRHLEETANNLEASD